MAANQTTPDPVAPPNLVGSFRTAGVVILVIGLVIAGLVYWLSPRPDLPDDLNTPDNNKIVARDVASNFGQWGTFSYNLSQALHDPATQAAIIAIGSILVGGGCFYIAHLNTRDTGAGGPAA
jgi:hypothetical protein